MSCLQQLSEEAKNNLFSAIFTKNYFLWIGSGFSYNFGFSSWNEVLISISEEVKYPLKLDVSNPLKAAELLCSYAIHHLNYDEETFNSLVSKVIKNKKKQVEPPKWVADFQEFAPSIMITTNWDQQLEEVFDHLAHVVIRKDSRPRIMNNGKNILKIHGDVDRPDGMVFTQSQYFSFQREETYLNRKIYTLFTEASPIFIGYSLTDPNIGFLYDEVYAHLGQDKPPAFMIVHPSVSEEVLEESKLLFQDKNIFIIKSDIGSFLNDVKHAYIDYRKSSECFLEEYIAISPRLKYFIEKVIVKSIIDRDELLKNFSNKKSRQMFVSACVDILCNQTLFEFLGGRLLTPENRMSFRDVDAIINMLSMVLRSNGFKDNATRLRFLDIVFELCAKPEEVWDFYNARLPFRNILRIQPWDADNICKVRIRHIIKVLRWSSPNKLGKCWATWDEFCIRKDWFSTADIDNILYVCKNESEFQFIESDKLWADILGDSKYCTTEQKAEFDELYRLAELPF